LKWGELGSEAARVSDEEPFVAGIDVTRPAVARIYDYWLGGTHNFTVDRETGRRMAEVNPGFPQLVRDNRRFLCAAAARAAAAGIAQFLDLGAGLPSHPAIHEAAREVNPAARVCYVDNDPVAAVHAKALLPDGVGVAAVEADLTEPDVVLADLTVLEVIDFAEPVGIILGAVLHFMPTQAAAELCGTYISRAALGSWLIVSTGHYEDKELAGHLQETATHTRFFNHDVADVSTWLTGLDVAPPGICEATRWVTGGVQSSRPVYALAAAAIKTT
jgi:hypothetical protein